MTDKRAKIFSNSDVNCMRRINRDEKSGTTTTALEMDGLCDSHDVLAEELVESQARGARANLDLQAAMRRVVALQERVLELEAYQKERTLCLIKPDVSKCPSIVWEIEHAAEAANLRSRGRRLIHLSRDQAAAFYGEHAGKHFFEDVVAFTASGLVIAQVLEGANAVRRWREIIGPANAAVVNASRDVFPKNLRGLFGSSQIMMRNAVHGSDSPEAAKEEIAFFFTTADLTSLAR
jgi:nucleoside-diphosphate kinase